MGNSNVRGKESEQDWGKTGKDADRQPTAGDGNGEESFGADGPLVQVRVARVVRGGRVEVERRGRQRPLVLAQRNAR
jgi:hypothetical protein